MDQIAVSTDTTYALRALRDYAQCRMATADMAMTGTSPQSREGARWTFRRFVLAVRQPRSAGRDESRFL